MARLGGSIRQRLVFFAIISGIYALGFGRVIYYFATTAIAETQDVRVAKTLVWTDLGFYTHQSLRFGLALNGTDEDCLRTANVVHSTTPDVHEEMICANVHDSQKFNIHCDGEGCRRI
jgi:hypothetical protein